MGLELVRENWPGKINVVKLGEKLQAGGQNALPFLSADKSNGRPLLAMEVIDKIPEDFHPALKNALGEAINSPAQWAKECVEKHKCDLVALRLQGTHPDFGNSSAEDAAKTVGDVLAAVNVPLIIIGCGDKDKDNSVLPAVCEAAKGKNCLIGEVVQDNYKTLTAACLADGHSIIAQSPIDVNIAKQLNILITDMGFPLEKIVINPTVGGLGYGIEYSYSVMERIRLAALGGDKMIASPFIGFVGYEAWRAKEAKAGDENDPSWGEQAKRGPAWEIATAVCLLQAGLDIAVLRHPKAVEVTKDYINKMLEA